ncbi:6-phosphogluconolactonase [Thioalkalivibrio nitratireducens]|uniref:6-phosphogluconolactonase n=1 Tax=Thioalkalivibrio nitratireducens TaxID=186931 RepID=UPI0012EDA083|nr:6-phosphogluconolactonase [Thioalkalivibrio nitratireducens]
MTVPAPDPAPVIVGVGIDDVMARAAERIAAVLTDAVAARGVATMALAGGNTPQRLYRLLAAPPYALSIPWGRVRLFLGDERWVPADHPDSNAHMVRELLLAGLPEAPAFFPMPTDAADPAEAAHRYHECLVREVPAEAGRAVPRLDLVLLGMGDDGHTASLFPGTPALDAAEPVAAVFVPRLDSWRLSLTLPVLNAARHVLFLVTGADKAATLARVLGDGARRTLPASLVRPADGELEWHVDREAAALLAGSPPGPESRA